MVHSLEHTVRGIAFIDLEAAGLGSNGYPTELGWAVVHDDGSIISDSSLIRPTARWTTYTNAWSAASERLTGISREMLDRGGLRPIDVMRQFLAAVEGCELFSDEPDFDRHWLGMLAKAALVDLAGREIGDAKTLIGETGASEGFKGDLGGPRHRAGPDARRLALLYLRARRGSRLPALSGS
jgi:DNA polymerase III epsilon subunit-like protein